MRKSKNEAPGGEATGIDPHEDTDRIKNDLQRDAVTLGTAGPTSARVVAAISTLAIHPLDNLGVIGLT